MSDKSFPNHRTIKPALIRWASLFFSYSNIRTFSIPIKTILL
nr:MAG TPA: hypothetical protein [Caudoviricetes sp.]